MVFRVVVAVLLAGTIVTLRFSGGGLAHALWIHTYLTYWWVLVALGWFMWSAVRVSRPTPRSIAELVRSHRTAIVLVVLAGAWLHVHEPHLLKVMQDEPAHVAGSLLMHEQRITAIPASAHQFDGRLMLFHSIPMVRMPLFPVLLSLLHDATGYRAENVFVLNGLLAGLVLTLIYVCGYKLAGKGGGVLAVLLFAGLPLFAQLATSGSYDLLNLAMLLTLFLATLGYLEQPSMARMDLMLAAGVLLALCRYESVLYLLLPIGAVSLTWVRQRSPQLGLAAMLSPLGVWPCFTANQIMMSHERYTLPELRTDGVEFFGLQNLPGNAQAVVYYLFNLDLESTGSFLLAVAGASGLIGLLVAFATRSRGRRLPLSVRLFACFALFTVGMYVFTLTHFWAMPTQSSASRFILPLCATLALAAAWTAKDLSSAQRVPRWMIAAAALFAFTLSSSSSAMAAVTKGMTIPRSYEWFLEYARGHDRGRTLYVAPGSVYLMAYGYPSVPTPAFNQRFKKAQLCLEAGLYDEILILELRWQEPSGEIHTSAMEPVAANIPVEVVAERRFSAGAISRILRLRRAARDQPESETPVLRTTFASETERLEYMIGLLP